MPACNVAAGSAGIRKHYAGADLLAQSWKEIGGLGGVVSGPRELPDASKTPCHRRTLMLPSERVKLYSSISEAIVTQKIIGCRDVLHGPCPS